MQIVEPCPKCSPVNTQITRPKTNAAARLLKIFGYRSYYCKKCGFSWGQFFPMSALLNLIYMLLTIEIGFLLLNYMR